MEKGFQKEEEKLRKNLETWNSFSPEKQREILDRQRKEYANRPPIGFEDMTNAEVLSMEQFKKFCAEKGYELTVRQASKRRQEFFEWMKGSE
ncbi:MAG: hypothetical protein HYT12_04225 [Candidatus Liptonbacteria bacterium]|nr:hypothetical protein [Candidatus Liptonbacteria bacterium]